jgi:hypothetical protein
MKGSLGYHLKCPPLSNQRESFSFTTSLDDIFGMLVIGNKLPLHLQSLHDSGAGIT